MYITFNRKILLILLLFIMFIITGCGKKEELLNITNKFYSMFNELTNSDNFTYNNNTQSIQEYSKNKAEYGTNNYKANLLDNSIISDEITAFIPKECFENIGIHYYLGTEYGFIVETNVLSKSNIPYGVFQSSVLLFDVTLSTPLLSNPDLNTKLEVLFTGNFISSNFENIQKIKNKKPLNNNFIMSKYHIAASTDLIVLFTGNNNKEYKIENIYFQFNIKNKDNLNYGDIGYDIFDNNYEISDFGDFFTDQYLKYNSSYLLNKQSFGDAGDQVYLKHKLQRDVSIVYNDDKLIFKRNTVLENHLYVSNGDNAQLSFNRNNIMNYKAKLNFICTFISYGKVYQIPLSNTYEGIYKCNSLDNTGEVFL